MSEVPLYKRPHIEAHISHGEREREYRVKGGEEWAVKGLPGFTGWESTIAVSSHKCTKSFTNKSLLERTRFVSHGK